MAARKDKERKVECRRKVGNLTKMRKSVPCALILSYVPDMKVRVYNRYLFHTDLTLPAKNEEQQLVMLQLPSLFFFPLCSCSVATNKKHSLS